ATATRAAGKGRALWLSNTQERCGASALGLRTAQCPWSISGTSGWPTDHCPPEIRWGRRISSGWQGGLVTVRGVLQIHSAPPALSPHIEWAVAGIFGVPVKLHWIDQPAAPGTVRTELSWQGRPGTSSEIASSLATWKLLRFEVSEEASAGC